MKIEHPSPAAAWGGAATVSALAWLVGFPLPVAIPAGVAVAFVLLYFDLRRKAGI
jgi:hypothetical protein